MLKNKKYLKNVSEAFLIKIINVAVSFLYNILLAKLLGASGTGIYYLAFSISSILVTLSCLGFNNSIIKFVAANIVLENWSAVKGICKLTIVYSSILSLSITVILCFMAPYLAEQVFGSLKFILPIRIMSISILPMTLISLIKEIFKAFGKYNYSLIFGGLAVPLIGIPFILIFTYYFGNNGAIISFVLCNMVVLLLSFYHVLKLLKPYKEFKPKFDTKLLISTSFSFFLIALSNIMISQGDVTLLGMWVDSSEIGAYGIAKRLSFLITFILIAVNTISAPKYAAHFQEGNYKKLKQTAQYYSKLLFIITTPLIIVLILFSSLIMESIGPGYKNYSYLLVLFGIAQYINVSVGSVGLILNMTGYEKIVKNYTIIYGIITIIITAFILFLGGGIREVAIIFCLNIIANNLTGLVFVKRKHDFYILSLTFPKLNYV